MDINEELKFDDKLDFDVAKVCRNNDYNPIILYTNKHNTSLKTMKEPTMEKYTSRLIFNFVLDTAATIYTICNLNLFSSYETTDIQINWDSANKLKAKYKEILILKTNTNQLIYLKNVYYIPELRINLLSINKLTNYLSTFTKSKLY